MDKMFGGLSLHHHMTNFETVVGWQGRIQEFHLGGGGGGAKGFVSARTLRARNRTHFRQGVQGPLKGPESLGLF